MPAPPAATIAPPSAGPAARAVLKIRMLSATAAASSALGTVPRMLAPIAGLKVAMPQASSAVSAMIAQAGAAPASASAAKQQRQRQHEALRAEHHAAPVVHVGPGPGGQREQQDRQVERGLHQGDDIGGLAHRGQVPRGAHRLHRIAEIGQQHARHQQREHAVRQRAESCGTRHPKRVKGSSIGMRRR